MSKKREDAGSCRSRTTVASKQHFSPTTTMRTQKISSAPSARRAAAVISNGFGRFHGKTTTRGRCGEAEVCMELF